MKKLLLITGFFAFFIFNVQAQDDKDFIKNKTTFGIKGGINFTYLHERSNFGKPFSDFYGGFFAETRLDKRWSFQNELMYSGYGGYSFFEVPLLIKYHFNEKWSVFAGPSLSFSLNDSNSYARTEFEPLIVSAVVGAQYNFSKKFFIEGRFNLGLSPQIDTNFGEPETLFRKTFRIGIGYRF